MIVYSISLIWETGENIKNWHDYVSVTISFFGNVCWGFVGEEKGIYAPCPMTIEPFNVMIWIEMLFTIFVSFSIYTFQQTPNNQ